MGARKVLHLCVRLQLLRDDGSRVALLACIEDGVLAVLADFDLLQISSVHATVLIKQ